MTAHEKFLHRELAIKDKKIDELKAKHGKLIHSYAKNIARMIKLKESHERLKEACLIIKEFESVDMYSEEWHALADKHMKLNDKALKQAK